MARRYSGVTRDRQAARNRSNLRRYSGLARTLSDQNSVSTRQLQAANVRRFGRSANYRSYGVQSNDQSIRGRLGETLSPRGTGNRVAGSAHRERWKSIRKAMGLSAS